MAKVACYTAVTADYDQLSRVPRIDGVDFIAFVDDAASAGRAGWIPMPLPTAPGELSPRMRAKEPKLLPHVVLPEYSATMWIDASHRIISPNFMAEAMPAAKETGFALHMHPYRDCIYDEAEASLELWKYASQPIQEQVDNYREGGHPEHWGLWACGSMVRRAGFDLVDAVMDAWWEECLVWTYQDQLSLPPVLRDFGLVPGVFPHDQVAGNPWFRIMDHPRDNE